MEDQAAPNLDLFAAKVDTSMTPADKIKRISESALERHRAQVEKHSFPGESFEAADRRLRLTDDHLPIKAAPTNRLRDDMGAREQLDFFVPSLYDVGARDSRSVMDVAVFRLSKRDTRAGKTITYALPDGTVTVSAGIHGMATIWDYDLVLMAVSHLTEAMNRYREGQGEKPGRVFRPHVLDVLKFLRRSSGGKQRLSLLDTCLRLNTTHVAIKRVKKGKNGNAYTVAEGEPLIQRYKVIMNQRTNSPEYLEIELAQWMYQEIVEGKTPEVLAVHSDYFLIDAGIARFVYRLARRTAGKKDSKWSFQTIFERSGSNGTFYKFTENLRKVIQANNLPEYDLREEDGKTGAQLIMTHRQYLEELQ